MGRVFNFYKGTMSPLLLVVVVFLSFFKPHWPLLIFCEEHIYLNTRLMTTHSTPLLHIYITYRMLGSTGPRANKSVKIHSALLRSGPAVSVCM